MKKTAYSLIFFLIIVSNSFSATYYVSFSSGLDTYNGSISSPFKTITKAVTVAVAGDIIYLRGGTHVYTAKITLSKNGTAANRFSLLAYPGDARPILDFSGLPAATRGVQLSGTYWTIKGIDFFKATDNGMHISGAFNIVEFCSFYENADTGLQLANGANNNQVINCDSYYNKDATDGNADGFAAKLDVGTGNSFKGCRAWQNSDDGWDGLLNSGLGSNPVTTYDSNWCFMNGYLKSGVVSVGNGNGFKMGGNNQQHDATLTRCLSAFNRVKGFDQNNNNGSMILYNCTGYKNKPNFGMNNNDPDAGKVMIVKNCISYLSQSTDVFRTVCTRTNNSWQISGFTISNADFLSVDSVGLRNPRNADGTLPSIDFMKLAATSAMVDAGVDVGLSYTGSAPDLGAFERPGAVPVELLFFEAVLKNNSVSLNWKTATEINNRGWEIEKVFASSNNPFVWQKIGFVKSVASGKNYFFEDKDIIVGNAYQYRLKQIDEDGKVKYSNVITIKIQNTKNADLEVYPNPIKEYANLNFTIANKGNVEALLYNQQGQLIKKIINENLVSGNYTRSFSLNQFAKGSYIILLNTANQTISKKILKVD